MIKKFSIIWFYIFTFIFTIILAGVSQVFLPLYVSETYQPLVFIILVQMAPTLGTILICLFIKEWQIWKNMNWKLFNNRRGFLWLLISIMIPTIIILITSIIMSLFGRPYISNGYSNLLIIITILVSFVGCIGEEIGWRGFMMPSLNKKYSLFISSILTGIFWGVWHIGKLSDYGMMGYLLFILLIIEFSVIMAWIYSRSNGKMFNMVFFHLGINVSSIILITNREGIMFYLVACTISAVICLMIVLVDRKKLLTKAVYNS